MVPFLAFHTEIRSIICTTNAIESLNARFRRAVNARGHFPNEQAANDAAALWNSGPVEGTVNRKSRRDRSRSFADRWRWRYPATATDQRGARFRSCMPSR
jgi:transposase-like protein